jgi:hypothetical protein
MILPEGFS